MVVFGFYGKQTKPILVKIIWAFISLGILTGITKIVLKENLHKLNVVKIQFAYITSVFAMAISETVHWLFAVEYYTVVTQFALFKMVTDPNFDQDEIDLKAKRTKTTIRVINVIFYTLVIACAILTEFHYFTSMNNKDLWSA